MIERIVFRASGTPLPAYYKVTTWSESGDVVPKQTEVIAAKVLDDTVAGSELTREDVVYDAVAALRDKQGTPDLTHSMQLMRPAETREYLRPFVRSAIWEKAMNQVVATMPFDLGEDPENFGTDLAMIEAFARGF